MSGVANIEDLAKVLGRGLCARLTNYLGIHPGAPFMSMRLRC